MENKSKISKIISADENWKKLLKSNPDIIKGKNKIRNGRESRNSFQEKKKTNDEVIWFDGVDPIHFDHQTSSTDDPANPLVKSNSFTGLTRVISMDCEMVGVENGDESILARVSIVNQFGQNVYDKYIKPNEVVTNYRTEVSGIRPSDLEKGEDFKVVQKEVSEILNKRILIGHAVHHDLKVLYLSHPKKDIRDTSRYKPFVRLFSGKTPSLKNLTQRLLGVQVQTGEHDSIQDAQAAMRLYTMHRKTWEAQLKMKSKTKFKNSFRDEKKNNKTSKN